MTENKEIVAKQDPDVSWWDWAMSTKEKVVNQSTEVLGYVKKDINEFTKVISQEASAVVSSTATVFKDKLNLEDSATTNQMKQSVSGFFNHVADVFTPPPDDSDVEAIMICNKQPVFLDRAEVAAYQLYSDHSNFLSDDKNDKDEYEAWLLQFNIENHQNQLSELLLSNEVLRQTYSKLVPTKVNHDVFWHRYFFKTHKINMAHAKREEMKQRMENSTQEDPQIVWDEDEDFGGDNEIPEGVQNKLFEDYEKEIQHDSDSKNLPETPEDSIHSELMDTSDFIELSREDKEKRVSPASSKDTEESWEKLPSFEMGSQIKPSSEQENKKSEENWENWE